MRKRNIIIGCLVVLGIFILFGTGAGVLIYLIQRDLQSAIPPVTTANSINPNTTAPNRGQFTPGMGRRGFNSAITGTISNAASDSITIAPTNGSSAQTYAIDASTIISKTVASSESEAIVVDQQVLVNGTVSGNTVTADAIALLNSSNTFRGPGGFAGPSNVVSGKITAVNGTMFTIQSLNNTTYTVSLQSNTTYTKSESGTISDLVAGTSVTILSVNANGTTLATQIRISK